MTEEGLASDNVAAHICNTSAGKRGRGPGGGAHNGDQNDQAATLMSEEDYTKHLYMHHESKDDGARAVRRWREDTLPAMHAAACAAVLSSGDLGPPHLQQQQQLEQEQQKSGRDGGDRSKCFAWLGLDFGVGEDGSAWLLEVNAAPELGIASGTCSSGSGNGNRGATRGVKERALAPLLSDLRRICSDRLTQLKANSNGGGATANGCDDDDAAAAEMLLRSMLPDDGNDDHGNEPTAPVAGGASTGDDNCSGSNGWVVAYEAPLSASSKSGGGGNGSSGSSIFRSDASPLECVGNGLGCGGSLGMAEQGVARWTAATTVQHAAARWLKRRKYKAEHELLSAVAAAAEEEATQWAN